MNKKFMTEILVLLFIMMIFHSSASARISNGWIYQTSYPTDNTLLSVKFITPQKGWIVGEHGIVLYTEDGGDNWEAQESGTEEDLKSVTFVNDKKGWAVGNGGVIIHTEDGGKKWTKQGDNGVPLHIVFFLNEKEGWVGGSMGSVLHTLDGGKSWKKQDIKASADIAGIFFLNSKSGWILSNAIIYRTKNGGKNWEISELPAVKFPFPRGFARPTDHGWQGSVYFSDEKKGWATVGIGFIFYTKDGGKTWEAKESTDSVDRIAFIDERHGCIAGTNILCTEDGGGAWREKLVIKQKGSSSSAADDYSVAIWGFNFAGRDIGWAVGKHGQMYKTEDGGKSWKIKSRRDYWTVYFLDSQKGWKTKDDFRNKKSSLYKTEDGGRTWEVQKVFDAQRVNCRFFFVNPSTGWAVGEEWGTDRSGSTPLKFFILHTNDGGKTWVTQFEEPAGKKWGFADGLFDVFFIDPNVGWVVGLKDLIYQTKDGGRHWTPQESGTNMRLINVGFVNNKRGWLTGFSVRDNYGNLAILYTDDGGNRWHSQWKKQSDWYGGGNLYVIDENHIWVQAFNDESAGGSIFIYTDDGGISWTEKQFENMYFEQMLFLDKNRGVIFSEKGQMLITQDGGKTLDKQRKPIRKFPWHISELFKENK